jgi:hypothetical protein
LRIAIVLAKIQKSQRTRNTKMKKMLILALLLTGCSYEPRELRYRATTLQYMKDYRTNLCFVVTPAGGSISYVPCTPEVEKYLFQ